MENILNKNVNDMKKKKTYAMKDIMNHRRIPCCYYHASHIIMAAFDHFLSLATGWG